MINFHLMEEHLNCVHWVIHSFIHVSPDVCGLEYDDLYQEGCIALWQAAETYNEQLGAQFHSYAISVIHNHLLDYCRKIQSRAGGVSGGRGYGDGPLDRPQLAAAGLPAGPGGV